MVSPRRAAPPDRLVGRSLNGVIGRIRPTARAGSQPGTPRIANERLRSDRAAITRRFQDSAGDRASRRPYRSARESRDSSVTISPISRSGSP